MTRRIAAAATERRGEPPSRRTAAVFLASWFGVGFLPWAPGTWGTAAALPLAWALSRLRPPGQVIAALVLAAIAIPVAGAAGRAFRVVDAPQIVVDEVAGLVVSLVAVPFTWRSAIAAFALFRLFDVLKPWPASFFDQRVKNGAGVVLDDVVAGLYARGLLAVVVLWRPHFFG